MKNHSRTIQPEHESYFKNVFDCDMCKHTFLKTYVAHTIGCPQSKTVLINHLTSLDLKFTWVQKIALFLKLDII